ncbi:MAG TPA: choline/carnitine O-acyltransferase [Streptosporangiaceae bacterium]|nr:choline/carnitine O-acyltransferase [Streptosporangiaceae bacterium]
MRSSQELSPRTFGSEDRLPRVPLPTLEESCDRFLEWCEPLLTADERAATETAVASFLRPDGPARQLHAALEQYDAADGVHSWLDTFWPYRYLGRRDRIALNANFFFLFEASEQGQVERAAGLVAVAVGYKLLIDEQLIQPAIQRGEPLSMEQNKYVFSATRIPGLVQDSVRTPYSEDWPGPSRERHIVIFVRGNMFRLDVIGPNGRPHALDEIAAGLRAVMEAGAAPAAPGTAVGHLTTKARAEWAASRQALLDCDPGNAGKLDVVETALFCLCLDDATPAGPREASDLLLHGDSGNRWFDKALSLIVFGDGTAGLNGEHCKLDGTTIVSFIDAALGSSAEDHSRRSGAESQGTPTCAPLDFVLDADLRADVRAAAAAFAAYAADTASCTLSIEGFDSERAKQLRMSPDAFAQMAFQLAHQRAKGHVGATYESISTRHYRHGRTEAMRVVTPEVVRFVTAMDDAQADEPTRRAAFRAAAEKHVERARECQMGHAPEQHLWELQLIQKRCGAELGVTEPLALYDTPGWLKMRDDYLSTSAVPSTHVKYFGFGSTSRNCIGVGYALLPDRFDLYLSTPRAVSEQMAIFAANLPEAVRELEDLLAAEDIG